MLSISARPDGGAALANNEIDNETEIALLEGDGLKQGLNSGNYKVVTGVSSSTGKLRSQKVWKVKSLDNELTDALTAGKGVICVQF